MSVKHWSGSERHRPDERTAETYLERLDRLGVVASPETARALAAVDGSALSLTPDDRLRVAALVAKAGLAAAERTAPTMLEAEQEAKPQRGSVYFIRHGQHIKIGFTVRTAERRLAGMQLPPGASIVGVIPNVHPVQERNLHKRFARYRVKGEWFSTTPELEALINEYRA